MLPLPRRPFRSWSGSLSEDGFGEIAECNNPEDASNLIYKAQVDLSKPYVDIASVVVWAGLSLVTYEKMGIESEKRVLLGDLDRMAKDFEDLYNLAYEKLKDMYEVAQAIQARREQI